ncbi:hypothetical protein AB0C02_23865 [Micromonospora sp. NPDC048999]|uniref:hypothetical protein n=1 Tax=Micromonospora sp. NPDC048999 TaxID=3155391 RepID=UPI0033CBA49A
MPVGLAGGDAGSGDAEPLGAGLLGPGVPSGGVGLGVDGTAVGLPDGLGVAVVGGNEGVPVDPGVGCAVGFVVGGLVAGFVAVGFGTPAAEAEAEVAGPAVGWRRGSVWATGTVGGATSAGDGPDTTSALGVVGISGVGVAGAGRRSGVPAARTASPESASASPISAKPRPAPPTSRAASAPVATGSAAERGGRGRRWAGNERS